MRRILICLCGGLWLTGCGLFQGAPAVSLSYEENGVKVACSRGKITAPAVEAATAAKQWSDALGPMRVDLTDEEGADEGGYDGDDEDYQPASSEGRMQEFVEACLSMAGANK